jgi:hypothetical protein
LSGFAPCRNLVRARSRSMALEMHPFTCFSTLMNLSNSTSRHEHALSYDALFTHALFLLTKLTTSVSNVLVPRLLFRLSMSAAHHQPLTAALALSPSVGHGGGASVSAHAHTHAHSTAADSADMSDDAGNESFELRREDDYGHHDGGAHDLMEDDGDGEEGSASGGEGLLSATARPLVTLASERHRQFGLAFCAQQSQLCSDELANEANHRCRYRVVVSSVSSRSTIRYQRRGSIFWGSFFDSFDVDGLPT